MYIIQQQEERKEEVYSTKYHYGNDEEKVLSPEYDVVTPELTISSKSSFQQQNRVIGITLVDNAIPPNLDREDLPTIKKRKLSLLIFKFRAFFLFKNKK